MLNEKFWLAVAFVVFAALIIKFIYPLISKFLGDKSKAIAEEILAAKEMKEKAANFLIKAEKYQKESEEYAKKLIKDAEIEAKRFADEAKKMVDSEIAKKTTAAFERIKMEEASAIRQIKNKIISSALVTISENADKEIKKEDHERLLSQSLQDFENIV